VSVWSVAMPELPGSLTRGAWSESGSSWTCSGRGWRLVVNQPVLVDGDDIPAQVVRSLPGLAFLTELHLEPNSAKESARTFALGVATAIARASHGAVLDEQEGTLTLPRGVRRYRTEPGTSVDLLTLSWWWLGEQLSTVEGIGRFLDVLEEHVPETLPHRYGTYEPPEFKLAERGRDHLLRFLHENAMRFAVLYPVLPALGLTLNLQEEVGHGTHGFAANHLQLDFDRAVLAQPGWEAALRRLWREVSLLLEPFYGDVRTLGGYERRGSRLWIPRNAQEHPVDGPFWAGLPSSPAHALVVGAPYTTLWPAMSGLRDHGLRFSTVEPWGSQADVFEMVGMPPDELVDPRKVSQREPGSIKFGAVPVYPVVWPFRP